MVANGNRKLKRQQLGVDRKGTATRWMGSLTVRVEVSRAKAGEGAERSFRSQRKTRRGQRGGFWRTVLLTKDVARMVVSAVRCAAPTTPSAPAEKTRSSRFVNHRGRKFLWAVKAANRLAARQVVQRLIQKLPEDLGYLSRSRAREVVRDLGVGETDRWEMYRRWWHVYSYKCRHIGAPVEGQSPLHFLGLRAPHVGGWDLLSLLREANLRPRSPSPLRLHVQACRSCGYLGPSGSHDFGAGCAARRRAERVAASTRRGGREGARSRR